MRKILALMIMMWAAPALAQDASQENALALGVNVGRGIGVGEMYRLGVTTTALVNCHLIWGDRLHKEAYDLGATVGSIPNVWAMADGISQSSSASGEEFGNGVNDALDMFVHADVAGYDESCATAAAVLSDLFK